MNREYPLVGEAFFRDMMQRDGDQRHHPVVGNRVAGIDAGSLSSNVVSLQDYRRQQAVRKPPYRLAPKLPV